jgi:hypothetical protein
MDKDDEPDWAHITTCHRGYVVDKLCTVLVSYQVEQTQQHLIMHDLKLSLAHVDTKTSSANELDEEDEGEGLEVLHPSSSTPK